jgi:hypothetical protein
MLLPRMPQRRSKSPEAKPALSKAAASAAADDVVLIHGVTDDGKGYRVLRKQGEQVSLGAVTPLEDGKPIHGEVVRLERRQGAPLLYDVRPFDAPAPDGAEPKGPAGPAEPASAEAAEAAPPGADRSGPARVASHAYRAGWDGIWGRRNRRLLN